MKPRSWPPLPRLTLALLLWAACLLPAHAQTSLTNGLVAYYPFNGNANDAAGTNHGTVNGAVLTTNRFSQPSRAYSFGGVTSSDSIDLNNTSLYDADNYTISVWFNVRDYPGAAGGPTEAMMLFSRGRNDFELHVGAPPFEPRGIRFMPRLLNATTGQAYDIRTPVVTTNTWFHLVATHQRVAGVAHIYLNGQEQTTAYYTGPDTAAPPLPIKIGRRRDGTVPIDGMIDDVRIYNRALAANEVAQLYAQEGSLAVLITSSQSATAIAGLPFTYPITATGTPTSYSATGLPAGLTLNTLTGLISGTPTAAGTFSVTLSAANASGTGNLTLTLTVAPLLISPQPQSLAVALGGTAAFSVGASGQGPFTYQWRFNGLPLSGQTNATLVLNGISSANGGNYSVAVSNAFGSAVSSNALLIVNSPALITVQPAAGQTVNLGATVTISVTAIGTAPLGYLWRRNDVNLPVPSLPTLTLNNVQFRDAGSYHVIVFNAAGLDISTPFVLALNPTPVITAQPQPQSTGAGVTLIFTVAATGNGPLAYQWLFNGVAIPGATNAALPLASVLPANTGAYSVVVTDVFGPTVSADAPLTVLGTPVITTQPQGAFGVAGTNLSLTVVAAGSPPPAFQWFRNGVPVAGATSPVLSFTNIQTTNSGLYTVTVTNLAGAVTSAPATLAVALGAFAPVTRPEPGMLRTNGFTFDLALAPGRIYRVQASTNLVSWADIAFLIGGTNAQQFVDRQATNSSRRFYRIVTP